MYENHRAPTIAEGYVWQAAENTEGIVADLIKQVIGSATKMQPIWI